MAEEVQINYCDKYPLHSALQATNDVTDEEVIAEVSSLLNQQGGEIDINAADRCRKTPIYYAVFSKRMQLVKHLLSLGADINESVRRPPIFSAIENDDAEIVKHLLDQPELELSLKNENGDNLLHAVLRSIKSEQSCLDLVRILMEKGANCNDRDKTGTSVLQWAVRKNHQQLFDYLIAKVDEIDRKNNRGESLLYTAVCYNFCHAVRVLTDKGAKIDDHDCKGKTILSLAVTRGKKRTTMLLLRKYTDSIDWQRLMLEAIRFGNLDVLELLFVKQNAPMCVYEGNKYLRFAVEGQQLGVFKYLLQKKASLNVGYTGSLPLYRAIKLYELHYTNVESIINSIIMHLALRKWNKLSVSAVDMNRLREKAWFHQRFECCLRELARMQETKVCDKFYLTYYDLLLMDSRSLMSCLTSCNTIYSVFKAAEYCSLFGNYANMFKDKFTQLERRLGMIKQYRTGLFVTFNGVLQFEVICRISDFIDNDEMATFVEEDVCKIEKNQQDEL